MGAILVFFSASSNAETGIGCLSDKQEFKLVELQRVTDGDTIVLSDQRRVRIIGLNALELNAESVNDRALAQQASEVLETLLATGPLLMIEGPEPLDRYGRSLAHIQLADGRNASKVLIEKGLALAVAVGKNTRCAEVALRAEQIARKFKRGLWARPGQWFVNEKPLGKKPQGFHLIRSNVQKLQGKGKKTTLVLNNGLHAKLGRDWPALNDSGLKKLHQLRGKLVEVRGWVGTSNGRSTMTLHHPANLYVLPE